MKQIAIPDPASDKMIEVDEGIAPLLLAIWSRGIITCNSCQENMPGMMWIEFLGAEDAEAFLTLGASGLDPINHPKAYNYLHSRMKGGDGGWRYAAHPHDIREYIDEEHGTIELNSSEQCAITLSISIRIPVGDYQRLRDILSEKMIPLKFSKDNYNLK